MLHHFARNWWAVGLRGILAIVVGITAFVWPSITLGALVFVFGFYAIVDGIFAIVTAGTASLSGGRRVWMLVEGVLSVGSGIIAFVWPGITALALLWLISAYAIITGVMEIAAAFQAGQMFGNGWLLGLSGVLSILFGLLLGFWPDTGLLSLVWLIGFYALVFGFMLIGLAWQLYRMHNGASQNRGGLAA